MPLTVAIIGRPNVGKSTLFNRLTGKRHAIVDDTPGVTRDRREGEGQLADLSFRLVDTAGLENADDISLEGRMRLQTEHAVSVADLVLFLTDARTGITPTDEHLADWLRTCKKPVTVVANKCEGKVGESGRLEAYALGLGDPLAVSAEHGEGLNDLYDAIAVAQQKYDYDHRDDGGVDDGVGDNDRPLKLAIVGRPNVGKSTLINLLIGDDRLLTGPEAGITRDSIAVLWRYQGRHVQLMDTAGMRRKAKISETLEKMSVTDSLRSIQYAEVVVLILDSNAVLEKQDLTIARRVIDEGRGLIIVVNKWDIADDKKDSLQRLNDRLSTSLPLDRGVPVITVSAKTGHGMDKFMPTILAQYEIWNRRIPTGTLNRWLHTMTEVHPPPITAGRRLRIRYITQAKSRPPTFILFSSRADSIPESYLRYLVNGLREDFNLPGTPIRMIPRKGDNPYAPES